MSCVCANLLLHSRHMLGQRVVTLIDFAQKCFPFLKQLFLAGSVIGHETVRKQQLH